MYRAWDASIYEVVTRLRNCIVGNGEMPRGTAWRQVHYFGERYRESVERMFAAVSDLDAGAGGNSLRVGTAVRTPA